MKILRYILLILGLAATLCGQASLVEQNNVGWGSGGAASGTSLTLPDMKGTVTEQFEVKIGGTAPSGTTVNVYGCMRGGTCSSSLANTSSTSSVLISPSSNAVYDYYKGTVSWTGGDSTTTIVINRTGTVGQSGGGSASGVSSFNTRTGAVTLTAADVNGALIANTTFTVSNATFTANTCTKLDSTAGSSTVTMTGMATTSVISIAPAADTAAVVGFGTTGGLVIDAWPTSNTANIKVCNQTASGITTGASLVFNISAR